MNDTRDSCAVLTITGSDEPDMLMRLATLATELNLNIEEAIGHTLADTVVLYANLAGDNSNLAKVEVSAGAIFDGLTVFAQVRNEPPLPLGPNEETMSPFPWKITVHSADVKGLLLELAQFRPLRGHPRHAGKLLGGVLKLHLGPFDVIQGCLDSPPRDGLLHVNHSVRVLWRLIHGRLHLRFSHAHSTHRSPAKKGLSSRRRDGQPPSIAIHDFDHRFECMKFLESSARRPVHSVFSS